MLNGKVALITGSTSGIGFATAEVLANAGCNIIVHGLLNLDDGRAVAKTLATKYNIETYFSNADMANPEEIE